MLRRGDGLVHLGVIRASHRGDLVGLLLLRRPPHCRYLRRLFGVRRLPLGGKLGDACGLERPPRVCDRLLELGGRRPLERRERRLLVESGRHVRILESGRSLRLGRRTLRVERRREVLVASALRVF